MSSTITPEEYARRRAFYNNFGIMEQSEKEELFKILQKYGEAFSKNTNGVFFNLVNLRQETFDDMEKFLAYCKDIRKNQAERETEIRVLKAETDAAKPT